MSYFCSPVIVATMVREPPWFLCSFRYIPCHVPRFISPSVIGILMETPIKELFTCAGISSAPSNRCSQCLPSGTAVFIQYSMSVRTSAQQFSLMVSDALVCWMNRLRSPTLHFEISGTFRIMESVTRWQPRETAGSEKDFCTNIFWWMKMQCEVMEMVYWNYGESFYVFAKQFFFSKWFGCK